MSHVTRKPVFGGLPGNTKTSLLSYREQVSKQVHVYEPRHEKMCLRESPDQPRHKPACAATEAS